MTCLFSVLATVLASVLATSVGMFVAIPFYRIQILKEICDVQGVTVLYSRLKEACCEGFELCDLFLLSNCNNFYLTSIQCSNCTKSKNSTRKLHDGEKLFENWTSIICSLPLLVVFCKLLYST